MVEPAPADAGGIFCFLSEELARYPIEAMFRFDLPRHGDTWALRIFPQLVCLASMIQGAERYLDLPPGSVEVERLRFTGSPRPGDSLLLKLRRSEEEDAPGTLSAELWVHHRLVAQGELMESTLKN